MASRAIRIFFLAALALNGVSHAVAQQADNAIVVGTVFDSSRAAVSGAIVRLTHISTNASTELRTDERGQYRTPSLRIGGYVVSVEAEGFKHFSQRGVELEIGDVRRIPTAQHSATYTGWCRAYSPAAAERGAGRCRWPRPPMAR